jgi:hypothetical protein
MKEVVLTVGEVRITGYELEKNYNRFKDAFRQRHGRLPGKEETTTWIGEFIDRAWFLADAFEKGYFNDAEVDRAVESMAHLIIGQPGGLLEQKLVEGQITVSEADIEKALTQSRKQLHVEYVKFPSYDKAFDCIGGVQVQNSQAFKEVVAKSRSKEDILHKEDTLQWPFAQLGHLQDYVISLQKDAVTSILSLPDGFYVMYVKNTWEGDLNTSPQRRSTITRMLMAQQKEKWRKQYANVIHAKAGMVIDTAVLHDLAIKLKEYGALTVFEKDKFSELLSKQVLAYNLGNEKIYCTVEAVMDYYNGLPLRKTIGSMQQVMEVLQSMVFDAYAYNRALELGITNEPRFVLDKENYRKTIVYNRYETKELKAGIVATEEEISNRYNAGKNEYRQAATAVVSLFSFNNRADAMAGRITIITNKGVAITGMHGLQNSQQNLVIDHDQSPLPDTITSAVFDMKVQDVSRVLPYKDNFLVVYKASESGSRIKSLEEMRPFLIKEIEQEKLQQRKQTYAAQLKARYRVTNRIDMQKYSVF